MFEGDYFLAQENVDKYADEVKQKAPAEEPDADEDVPETAQQDSGGDPTDGAQLGVTVACADNWKASQAGEVRRGLYHAPVIPAGFRWNKIWRRALPNFHSGDTLIWWNRVIC